MWLERWEDGRYVTTCNAAVSIPNNERGNAADDVMQTMNDISPRPLARTFHPTTPHRR